MALYSRILKTAKKCILGKNTLAPEFSTENSGDMYCFVAFGVSSAFTEGNTSVSSIYIVAPLLINRVYKTGI
jgi:hypothetical protein